MTEPLNDTTTGDVSAAAPAVPVTPAVPAAPRRHRTRAYVTAGMAVALLAAGGIGAAWALDGADRTAATRYWSTEGVSPRGPEVPAAVPPNGLTARLLPVPGSHTPGPDLGKDGNDFFVTGDNAVQDFKDARRGLSDTQRKKRDEALAELKLKGRAGRSYTGPTSRSVVEIRLMQADPRFLGKTSEVSRKLMDAVSEGRETPKVEGFPDARCAVVTLGDEEREGKIDSMECVAVEGDVLVSFRSYGPQPFSTRDAVTFFQNQLKHLKSPGESV
ncbi:hypothetical protein AB0D45_15540 [Streptomyces sp. NPDC048352]|uniref:hypothetical protein n=1 Tax=Streptomyces sp. NPDC048352 TaxID=3154718 RepID=UPI003435EE60